MLPSRYVDRGRIAAGGFGEVRRVEDVHLRCTLAMKILKPDRASAEETRRRFLAEARLTAWLNHPGIVAVQDLGELDDGRIWYTMQEVQGQTLSAVIDQLHGGASARTWTLRRVVDALMRACQTVASAHAVGVIHRDLKPDNLMIGAFGEVRVMDWGLARRLGGPDETAGGAWGAPTGEDTVDGSVMGTPAYMPPEQARGDQHAIGPGSDVYALGATLYQVLSGSAPYGGSAQAAWRAVLAGPPPALGAGSSALIPEELVSICELAMAREPDERFADAGQLAAVLDDWLEGAKRRAEAETQVVRARARMPEADRLRAEAERLDHASRSALADVPPSAPVEAKVSAWRLADEGQQRVGDARRLEAEVIRDVRAALTRAADLPAAHELLADLYRARLDEAEQRGDPVGASEYELALRDHDRGRHAAWLRGDGVVSLVTDPPGAEVTVLRVEVRDRRCVEVPAGTLGVTPIVEARLPRGAYVLVLQAPRRAPVRYPIQIGRLEAWDGTRPGDAEPHAVHLPLKGTLDAEDCYVPAGWFWSGGDPNAVDALPRRRRWVDGFVICQFPVSVAAYLGFLDHLVAVGREAEAAALCPRGPEPGTVYVDRDPRGRHLLPSRAQSGQELRLPEEPVAFVSALGAEAFAAYQAESTGLAWSLPHDLVWEKAARGVDGRFFPWGNTLDPSFACMQLSHAGIPTRAPVAGYPIDVSPYGVRGLGGNVRDWCSTPYQRGDLDSPVVPWGPGPGAPGLRMARGGSLASTADLCRAAGRVAWSPTNLGPAVGFRLVRPFTGG